MQYQIEVPFQAGGITDHDGGIRPVSQKKVPGHLLLRGMCHQGISARKIGNYVSAAVAFAEAKSIFDCFSRPVPGVLIHSGEPVKKSAFPYIGISYQRNKLLPGVGFADLNLRSVCGTDGNDSAANQKSGRIACRALSHTANGCPLHKAQVPEPAAGGARTGKRQDFGSLFRFHII